MSRKLYLLLLLLCCITFQGAFAQKRYVNPNYVRNATPVKPDENTSSKLDLRLYHRLQSGNILPKNMPLVVRGDLNAIQALTEKLGGHYKYGYNNISSVDIPEANVLEFSRNKAVEKIAGTSSSGTQLMDTARIRNNIDSIVSGFAPLTHSLKGKDVVVGIIDGGIYWQHDDFKNPLDGSTRIKYIWDQQVSAGNVPGPYNYGTEWTAAQINSGNCTHTPPNNDFGHGTCVAGIAAGNGNSVNGTQWEDLYTGVAPQSDIIAVRVASGNNFLSGVTDAIDYIFKKADSLGKPCVINTSVGDYWGSHDGNDDVSHLIDAMITAKNGRVVVAAAGNGGQSNWHLSYNIPADSAYTYFNYNSDNFGAYFDWWADTADFNNAYFTIGCYSSTGVYRARTAYFNVPIDFHPTPTPNGDVYPDYDLFDAGNNWVGTVHMRIALDDDRYQVEVFIEVLNTSDLWRLQMKGSGTFDLWASSAYTVSSDIMTTVNGGPITDPAYRFPDNYETMVSYWQNSDKVITVGNYSNRASYIDRDGNVVNLLQTPYFETIGQRFGTSSLGPTRDNRVKPDVMATGSTTVCTGDANFIAAATAPANRVKVSITQKHIRNGGTSMASPIVAGIAALYLEKYPNASYSEIKQALICTAKEDNFTGSVPNAEYGNGKVDGFAAIAHSCIVYGNITDTSCLYYNPLANTDTGCVAKVYGVMDTACLNYNPLANVSGGVCVPKVYGVMDTACVNYNALANVSGGICVPKVYGVMDTACLNYNPLANVNNGVCVPKVYGVMDTACMNYNALANVSGGVCVQKVYGVMDTSCVNYNPNANLSGGVCVPKVYGITDTSCLNYNPLANVSSGVCTPKVYGVMDTSCLNYNANANVSGGICTPKVYGIMDTACMNYNANANVSGGVCVPKVYGVMDTSCFNYNPNANLSGGVCVPKVYGVTDTSCLNYNPNANVNSGVCTPKVYGVMDTSCLNYNANANVSGGVCTPKVYGVMDTSCINYNPAANVSGGACVAKIYGVMDTSCINYDAAANVAGGSCVAKVYGATDTSCTNYNAQANIDNNSCITSVSFIGSDKITVEVIPNPFTSQATFIIDGLTFTKGRIIIYNQLGQQVDEFAVTPGKTQYIYYNNKLAKAIYNYVLQADGRNIKAGKLVVQ